MGGAKGRVLVKCKWLHTSIGVKVEKKGASPEIFYSVEPCLNEVRGKLGSTPLRLHCYRSPFLLFQTHVLVCHCLSWLIRPQSENTITVVNRQAKLPGPPRLSFLFVPWSTLGFKGGGTCPHG